MLAEIEDDLDGGDLELVTKKLSAIQSSLKILTHAPDYEERVLHVEGLKNRLEAMSSPHLVQAFNNNDLAKAQFFVKVFGDMERSSQLLKYYRKVRVQNVMCQLQQHQELDHFFACQVPLTATPCNDGFEGTKHSCPLLLLVAISC